MIHTYRLHAFAPALGWLRWSCATCGRAIDQNVQSGALTVRVAGQDAPHGGRAGRSPSGTTRPAVWRLTRCGKRN